MVESLSRRDLLQRGVAAVGAARLAASPLAAQPQAGRRATPAGRGSFDDLGSILETELPAIAGNRFLSAMRNSPGGSYRLGKQSAEWDSLTLKSDESEQLSDGSIRRDIVIDTPQGLRLTRRFRFYPKYQAVEHQMVFENTRSDTSDALRQVLPLDLFFRFSDFEQLAAYTPGIGEYDAVYPDPIWRLAENLLLSNTGSGMPGHEWRLATARDLGDRGAHHPMVFVEDQGSGEGMFIELGWAGRWEINFRWVDFKSLPFRIPPNFATEHPDTLEITAGMPVLNIQLRPGQKITSPPAVFGFFSKGLDEGRNLLRHLKLHHFRLPWPKTVPDPPTIYDYFYSAQDKLTERDFRKLADRAADLGIEYFFVGADWRPERPKYESPTTPWSFPVDAEIFPERTLRPFSDYVHSKGMKFGLWFDAERAYRKYWPIVDEHPEWFLRDLSAKEESNLVVDLGNPDALTWMTDRLSDVIDRWKVDFFFHDRLGGGERFWDQFDPPRQRGITELKYIEGRWEMWRRLNARFPELLILNPGGHDIGSMRNTHLTMAGRHTGDGNASRYDNSVLNWFYPSVHVQSDFVSFKDSYKEPYGMAAWLSRFPAMLGIGDPIGHWSQQITAQGKKAIQVYKQIRHLLKGDFYPFFPPADTLKTWDGWQFHDPASGEGIAILFRLRYCDEPKSTVRFHGVREDEVYRLRDPFGSYETKVSGKDLSAGGLTVELEKDGAQLLRYAPACSATRA